MGMRDGSGRKKGNQMVAPELLTLAHSQTVRFGAYSVVFRASLMVKNLPARQETQVRSLRREDLLGEEKDSPL